jgi:hypothetical protein
MLYDMRMGDDGILRVFASDKGQTVGDFFKAFDSFIESVTSEDPLLILVDARRAGKLSLTARKAFVRLSSDPRLSKCAVLGLGRYQRLMVNFFNRVAGQDKVRLCATLEQALDWLTLPGGTGLDKSEKGF